MIGESESRQFAAGVHQLARDPDASLGGIARHFEFAFNSFFEFCTGPFQVVLLSWEDSGEI